MSQIELKQVSHKIRYYNWLLDERIITQGSTAYHIALRLLRQYKVKYYCLTH